MSTPSPRRNVSVAKAVVDDGRPKYIIAADALIPANVLGGIISGRVQPTAQQRARLAGVLHRSESDLFGEASLAQDRVSA